MELLSPAGSLEKLRYAVLYGADAVYASGEQFGLRAQSTNFDYLELKEAVAFCHKFKKKIYITVNIFARNKDLNELPGYLTFLQNIGVDALIVSDPAIFSLAQEYASALPIHISTQANVTSWKSADFWFKQGARRIILARELNLYEIKEIRQKLPEIELEIFVHGAMCMAYSGRCLLSNFLNSRDANRGNCSQPCRWKYHLLEETRPGEYFPVEQDNYGTYLLNSRDVNLIRRLPEIQQAGIDAVKIEGRMKSLYYVANVTRTYRQALNNITSLSKRIENLSAELEKVSHRVYSEGFFTANPSSSNQHYENSAYIRSHQYLGEILTQEEELLLVNIKAKFSVGDLIEMIFPDAASDLEFRVTRIYDEENNSLSFTKPNTIVKIAFDQKIQEYGILRMKLSGK
ncbi:MAG: U32 family peptidase [Candidatus Cloacimonetes bacterium]|nr:U32 family peptidase [Candidatus Cloacimonadota bacterium]